MSRQTYVDPADEKAFTAILAKDPECNRCFECGGPNPQWCDVMHGTFICLNCSGQHRSLGVHLSFVRSSTMDGWTNWKPEKLRQMELGGNRRARLYFEAHDVPKSPIKARYESLGALRYADLLQAEALGKPFNEATWKPPAWYTRLKMQTSPSPSSPSPTAMFPPTSPNRFTGIGSSGQSHAEPNSNNSSYSSSGGDWFSALSSGWNAVSQKTAELAQQASVAVQNADVDGMKSSLAQRWANVSSTVSSTVSTYATELQHKMADRGGKANWSNDDGFAGLMQHARQARAESGAAGAPVDPARFGHIEGSHASPVPTSPLRGTPVPSGGAGLPPASAHLPVYQGRVVSASPADTTAAAPAVSHSSTVAMPVAVQNRPPNPLSNNNSSSGVGSASGAPTATQPQKTDDWAWDDF
ncbi:ADP-ribosylation factor GTPase activating protein 1 [Lotmaria passim]